MITTLNPLVICYKILQNVYILLGGDQRTNSHNTISSMQLLQKVMVCELWWLNGVIKHLSNYTALTAYQPFRNIMFCNIQNSMFKSFPIFLSRQLYKIILNQCLFNIILCWRLKKTFQKKIYIYILWMLIRFMISNEVMSI